jgi:hypothetical protein
MFMINTFQWPWTQIAALVPPRPMLFENSGHDTIFPMNGNDRIRARLEKLYGFYTNRTDRLFDIGVTAGGHDDKVELRLMAYRWINRHLKGDDSPVTEPEFTKIEGKKLRAFPEQLPADERNTRIDESFVPMATNRLPQTLKEFQSWRQTKLTELRRLVFRSVPETATVETALTFDRRKPAAGTWPSEPGVAIPWRYFPPRSTKSEGASWLVVLEPNESLDAKPEWLTRILGDAAAILVAPRGTGPLRWEDPAPYYIQRSLPLLGRTVDSCRLVDVLAAAAHVLQTRRGVSPKVNITGHGAAGVIAAYAALLEPRLSEVVVVDPPPSHRDGPIFLNVLRVLDVPEAFGLLAPRSLTIYTSRTGAFAAAKSIYQVAGSALKLQPAP